MNKSKRVIILQNLRKDSYYLNMIEMNFSSAFEILVAALLSVKTTDISVNRVTMKLYSRANTPKAFLQLGVEEVKYYIKSLGLFNKKAENLIKTCSIILEKYDGKVPEDRNALESLPGIGRKVANVILNSAFGWPTIAVDTHVFRVCNRTNFAPGKNVKQVEEKLLRVVPKEFKVDCHRRMVIHGRNICTARKPNCKSCVIKDLCEFKEKII